MSCEDKVSYKTYEEATAAKIMLQQQGIRNLKPYKCKEVLCAKRGLWHLAKDYGD